MLCKSRYWVLLIPAALIIGAVALYCITPTKAWWLPPCLFHKFTGLHCPGCGTTRGLHALLHGHIRQAFRFNVLTISAIPVLVYCLARVVLSELTGRKARSRNLPAWMPWAVAGIIAGFWIARNIPIYPFTLLAPH